MDSFPPVRMHSPIEIPPLHAEILGMDISTWPQAKQMMVNSLIRS